MVSDLPIRSESAAVLVTPERRVLEWKFTELDTVKDDMLSKIELRSLLRMLKKLVRPKACAKSFAENCDIDQDGGISRAEWSTCLAGQPDSEWEGGRLQWSGISCSCDRLYHIYHYHASRYIGGGIKPIPSLVMPRLDIDFAKLDMLSFSLRWIQSFFLHIVMEKWWKPMKVFSFLPFRGLTHWGRETNIWVSNQISIGLDNGFSPGRRQAIIWTNAGILLIRTLEHTSVKS